MVAQRRLTDGGGRPARAETRREVKVKPTKVTAKKVTYVKVKRLPKG